MQNDLSVARKQHHKAREVLSPAEVRGRDLKRCVRAAAAFQEIYDDKALAEAVGVGRGALTGWWRGSRLQPENIERLAAVTDLAVEELTQYVYFGGPLPRLPEGSGPAGLREGVRRGQEPLADGAPDTPAQSPGPPPHDVEGEHAPRRGT